jgi:hypothetical protein
MRLPTSMVTSAAKSVQTPDSSAFIYRSDRCGTS